ncbi:MAG: translation initiation factor IF-2 [Polyangiaceae bacterium]|nr:translation initiation factor IF-2 [Polyangiaceae bacterium]
MSKLRVYEVAKDLGLENKALVALFQSVGVTDVRNHMSVVGIDSVERVKRVLEKQHSAEKTVEERIRPTVVKRRAAAKPAEGGESDAPAQTVVARAPEATRPAVVVRRPAVDPTQPRVAPAAAGVAEVRPPVQAAPVAAVPEVPQVAAPPPAAPAVEKPVAREKAQAATPAPVAAAVEPAVLAQPSVSEVEAVPAKVEAVVAAQEPAAAAPAQPVEHPVVPQAPPSVAVAPPAPPPPPPAAEASPSLAPATPSQKPAAPKTGIDVWEGRPGVPMPQVHRSTGPVARRVQYDAKAGNVGGRPRPGGPMVGGGGMPSGAPVGGGSGSRGPQQRGGGMRQRGLGSLGRGKGMGQAVTQERSAHKKVVRVEESVLLQTLAGKMQIKATEVLMKLMRLGMTGVNINSTLDADTAKIVANEFGWEVEDVTVSEEDAIVAAQGIETVEDAGGVHRPPVVTVMGHVDHGKTSLLDKIRQASVASGEAGGITQHIGAYTVETKHGTIAFLDTPGHEAFTAMRARGAQATDIVILVVAADDGVMPQTLEAINHARSAKVPILVAVNKCDKPDAQPERVRRELSDVGLLPEEWGGDTLFAEVSAMTGAGIDGLLDQVILLAEMLELKANPDKPASGVVIEAQLDRGRGPVATVLITDGTLRQGDVILAGGAYGKVRAMVTSNRTSVLKAGPSTPVEIIGLNDVPSAGDPVYVIRDMKTAQGLAESRKVKDRRSIGPSSGGQRMSLEELARAMSETDRLDLKVIIKADVQGSVEALTEAIQKLATPKVKVSVVHVGVGGITEGDVNLAIASGAIIIGFNARPAGKASALAQQEKIEIRQYSIIYNVVDDIRAAMEGLLAPTLVEKVIGRAEVRMTFRISKAGTVAGCMVVEGIIKRAAGMRLIRDKEVIFTGKASSLKRFKDDAREVKEGFECGISLEGYNDIKEGDIIEAFEMEEIKQTL